MDKLHEWMKRIQRAPLPEVANLDYWDLLTETRIAQGPGLGPFRSADARFPGKLRRGDDCAEGPAGVSGDRGRA